MYLKRLEMIGFKSFADRTRLEFGPGMMAIVGPNGCGKSNIADAIRWVLGEQSAKALRGAKMEDCIFAGTDVQKPLGMAEVSLTLADCESALGTEYHEVTVTRRVYRSGEGQYLINRSPCRLKDIQRLFMDTGIGTQSYSLMEQGRIDRILSSRPEDRRSVFEEASGITKFKADRKEALRKLDQTEANLMRLADIIREVRRQIISLQRQAGKARRFKALQDEMRSYELFFTRERLAAMDAELSDLDALCAGVAEREEAAADQVRTLDEQLEKARSDLGAIEQELEQTREVIRGARAELDRNQESVARNVTRIEELEAMASRDSREVKQNTERLTDQEHRCSALAAELATAEQARDAAAQDLQQLTDRLKAAEDALAEVDAERRRLGAEALDIETRISTRQKEFGDLEARERSALMLRERLEAERVGLNRALRLKDERTRAIRQTIEDLGIALEARRADLEQVSRYRHQCREEIRKAEQALRPLREHISATAARMDIMRRQNEAAEGFPGGARLLLETATNDGLDRRRVLGTLADLVKIKPDARVAFEAVLRPWLDAVVVQDADAAHALMGELARRAAGSARLLAARVPEDLTVHGGAPDSSMGDSLRRHVECPPEIVELCDRLLAGVVLVESIEELPHAIPPGSLFVTRDGLMATHDGMFSCWLPDADDTTTPVARQTLLRQWSDEHEQIETAIARLEGEIARLNKNELTAAGGELDAREAMDQAQRALTLTEGEQVVLDRETGEDRQRLETVVFEIEARREEGKSAEGQRSRLREELDRLGHRQEDVRAARAAHDERLQAAESKRRLRTQAVNDQRIQEAVQRREAEGLAMRLRDQRIRIHEFEETIRERNERIRESRARIEELHRDIAAAKDQQQPMANEIRLFEERLAEILGRHEQGKTALEQTDQSLRQQREAFGGFQRDRAQADVDIAQRRTRRQDLMERITQDYRIMEQDLFRAPEPDWSGEDRPDRETLEMRVAEMRAKLDSMGPVNLVAIEEHEELEKRFAFLEEQQNDLVKSKQQLLDLIRRINQTTTTLFAETFQMVNDNFGVMFTRLFGGGSAKLLLVDEADVLESGIEIIARPPGKKLQSISLLSGGERTMAAVALLFALYQVKPSPFCLLDELDAALDDANIGRFVTVVEDFLRQSQFIVITHNRQTIATANALYGVTMERQGISRIVSVRFNRDPVETAPEPATTPPEPASVGEA